jgi:predicted RecA/RadA family phage recombinase
MKNFVKPGDVVTRTAPAGGVVSGNGYMIGQQFVVATADVAAGLPFEGVTRGVVSLAKAAGAWVEGVKVFWSVANKNVDAVATGNVLIGVADAAAAAPDTTGWVWLDGSPR